jgi:hypothetical protein
LRTPTPIELHDPANSPGVSSALFSFWPYLLLASLLLFFVEWFINPHMTSVGFRRRSKPVASLR